MASSEVAPAAKKPLWRKIVDFPLVAMLIAAFSFLLLYGLIAIGMRKAFPIMPKDEMLLLVDVIAAAAMILLYKGFIRHLGDPKRDDLPAAGAVRQTLIGVAVGAALFSLVVAVAAVLGVYRVDGMGSARDLLPALIASAIFPGISEELFFRGILFRWIEEFGGSWLALLLTSAFFGAAHLGNPNATWIGAVGIAFEAGVMLGAAYMLTRSLWLPMGLHAAWNFTQGEVFDVPVSGTSVDGLVQAHLSGPPLLTGGAFGLEASLIAIVIATGFGLWLLWLAIRKGELVQPMWAARRRIAPVEA
jgi:membrane protease YdiL (CAAX protease family)